jgi:hypothetical protein
METYASALGAIVFAEPAAYRLETLPTIIFQLREAQTYLEQRYASLRKAASETAPAARGAPTPSAAKRKRGRPANVRANGQAPASSPPLPLEDGPYHGEQTAAES